MLRKLEGILDRERVTIYGSLWIRYVDAEGPGLCNPDIVLECDDRVLVLECKLTQTDVAENQIFQLYAPVIRLMWNKPILGVAVFRNLIRQPKNPILNLTGLLTQPLLDCDVFSTWHLTL